MSAIDIEAIMEEIRETVKAHGPYEAIPAFDEIPLEGGEAAPVPEADNISGGQLRGAISRNLGGSWTIPWVYPIPAGNPMVRGYKKVATKLARCAVAPVAQRVTETNQAMKGSIEQLASVIEQQQAQIQALKERLDEMEKREQERAEEKARKPRKEEGRSK